MRDVEIALLWAFGIVAVAGGVALVLAAQTPASPAFEVASAKADEKAEAVAVNGQLTFSNMPLAALINTLANLLDSPVQDETGLRGSYDFKLTTATAADGPTSIFTVVQEQLGLKLEPTKEPLDVS